MRARARAHGPDRHPQSDCRVLVAEPGPGAEREDLLLATRKSSEQGEGAAHQLFVVDPLVAVVREARLRARLRNAPERRRVTTLGATAVANDVRGDPKQPREFLTARQLLIDPAPGLEEDDRDEILGDGPAPNAAEAVVVDRLPWRSKSIPNASESPERARDHRTESSSSTARSCPTSEVGSRRRHSSDRCGFTLGSDRLPDPAADVRPQRAPTGSA